MTGWEIGALLGHFIIRPLRYDQRLVKRGYAIVIMVRNAKKLFVAS